MDECGGHRSPNSCRGKYEVEASPDWLVEPRDYDGRVALSGGSTGSNPVWGHPVLLR
jgi:hypothetical protein